MIRIVIADDQALIRSGFRMILDSEDDMEVVGEAADGQEAVEMAESLNPDVVLMDIRMPNLDGIEATRRIVGSAGDARILILTTFDLDEYLFSTVRAGASGFLLKDSPPESLVEAIRVVAQGDALIEPRMTRRLIDEFARRPEPTGVTPEDLARLTPREIEVLKAMARGSSNSEIAEDLFISETTVKTHVAHILTKLGLRDRIQAVVTAYETGLILAQEGGDGH